MTTSSAIEPETETHIRSMHTKTSSPMDSSSLAVLTPPAALPSPLETEFTMASGTFTATTTVLAMGDSSVHPEDQGNEALTPSTTPTTTTTATSDLSDPFDAASLGAGPLPAESGSQTASAGTMIDGSRGRQSAASYVPNGTHDSTATSTSEGDADASRRTPHPQPPTEETGSMGRENEEQENVTSTSSTRTHSLILEHDSTSVDMGTSITSPARHTPIPPSNSSSESIEHHMIAESSTAPHARPPKRASLSPGCSMASIPRDVSAAYNNQLDLEDSATNLEELYGKVDRYGFLVEEGRTPFLDNRNGAPLGPPQVNIDAR
ncbi:hypothetical protein B0O80DRAFT_158105 [Mortierella sp. GBAus27b]|nr:hypothetical protein B0O80DRAFT_158105 [Mortierella sp. GBAus27b]